MAATTSTTSKHEKIYKNFTIKLNYGGQFMKIQQTLYIGGSCQFVNKCHYNEMSLCSLENIAEKISYGENIEFYYKKPGMNLDDGLVFLACDDDVLEMCKIHVEGDIIDVYVDGPCKVMHLPYNSQVGSSSNVDKNAQGFGNIANDEKGKRMMRDDMENDYEPDSSDGSSFHDSEFNLSEDDDDRLYEQNIDKGVELLENMNKISMNEIIAIENEYGKDIECSADSLDLTSEGDFDSLENTSDEDNGREKQPKFQRFRADVDMNDPYFVIGMLFSSADELKLALKAYGIKYSKDYKLLKNDNDMIRASCKTKTCRWFVYAVCLEDKKTFQIRTMFNKHSCGKAMNHKLLTSKQLCRLYLEDIRLNLYGRVCDFQTKVHNDFGVNVSRKQVYKAFSLARTVIEGQYKEQYKLLWNYCEELKRTNPGSTVCMETIVDEESREETFLRFYVCLEACRRGFLEGCRHVVGLDGCHLKGPHPGILLTAVGIDPNNCIFPIAYCVSETENKISWSWFLNLLVQDLEIYDQERWTFITDKQKGLIPAISEIVPCAEHRHCVRHLYNNFKKVHGGIVALKARMWKAAKAPYIHKFQLYMNELKEYDNGAYEWLAKEPAKFWSRSHFITETKCDILLNNLCESFNAAIMDARDKSILVMLEKIRIYLMMRMQSKREWMRNYKGSICPKICKILNQSKDDSAPWNVIHSGGNKFQVRSFGNDQYVVDLGMWTCSCRKWELSGIPCAHATTAISYIGYDLEDFVHECYRKEAYLRAYEPVIEPINGPDLWPISDKQPVLAPKALRLPGRPKMLRKREPDEIAKGKQKQHVPRGPLEKMGRKFVKLKCTLCKQSGHNRRRCNNIHQGTKDRNEVENESNNGQVNTEENEVTNEVQVNDDNISNDLMDILKSFETNPWIEHVNSNNNEVQVVPSNITSETRHSLTNVSSSRKKLPIRRSRCKVCLTEGHDMQTCTTAVAQRMRERKANEFSFQIKGDNSMHPNKVMKMPSVQKRRPFIPAGRGVHIRAPPTGSTNKSSINIGSSKGKSLLLGPASTNSKSEASYGESDMSYPQKKLHFTKAKNKK